MVSTLASINSCAQPVQHTIAPTSITSNHLTRVKERAARSSSCEDRVRALAQVEPRRSPLRILSYLCIRDC
ncbi:hypothetical protein PENSPDRAFT_649078 [Peniophora sp. CONT]|nr:hypothetical protein PENSPDRAFT_649078 [Peniophora sp. CONT]